MARGKTVAKKKSAVAPVVARGALARQIRMVAKEWGTTPNGLLQALAYDADEQLRKLAFDLADTKFEAMLSRRKDRLERIIESERKFAREMAELEQKGMMNHHELWAAIEELGGKYLGLRMRY